MKLVLPVLALLLATPALGDFPAPYNSGAATGAPPMSAAEAAAKMKVPAGFRVSVFAAEPAVQNPIAMAWDHRGRMWVAENYTYAERPARFDLSLRDRVIILEDADNDGHAESRKVFIDDVQMLTSIELGRGGVWLMCPPQLLFVPMREGEDKPAGPPQVMLDGFAVAKDNYHNFANGLRWGPDGWLYGRCGHSCPGLLGVPGTPEDQRVPLNGGIWRFNPQRKVVEVLCHGTTNPWGHDWDKDGELFFINTVNGHLWHAMTGAYLKETSGVNANPNVYEQLDTIADHWHFDTKGGWQNSRDGKANDLGGGHAHVGMMIYQGEQWPEVYRGKLFTLNFHGRRANVDRLERLGAGYVGRHEPDVFLSADPWFRGIDIRTGPDGSAFVLDYSDTGECHQSTGVNRTSGRIYKISYGEPRKPALPMLEPHCLARTDTLGGLWKEYREGRTTPAMLRGYLGDADEHVRVWAIRLLTDAWPLDTNAGPLKHATYPEDAESRAAFVRLAQRDPSGLVLLTLASTLQRLPVNQRAELAAALVTHEQYAKDQNLPSLVWYGLMPLGDADPVGLVSVAKACRWPTTLRWITRNLATRIEQQPQAVDAILGFTADRPIDLQEAVLGGLREAFEGWRKVPKPAAWDALAASDAGRRFPEQVRELSTLFGDGRALDDIKRIVLDAKAELPARQAALKTLIDARPPELRQICESLLGVRVLNTTAVRGLAQFDDPAIGVKLAQSYRKFHPLERPGVIDALTSRASFARALLDNVGPGGNQIPRADVTPFHARRIRGFDDAELTRKLAQVWGELRESDADTASAIAGFKAKLTPDVLAKADLGQGRKTFAQVCAVCHTLYGEGGKVGPDLTGSGRANLDYLLENIVDPSAVVAADYRVTVLALKDGRLLTGIVKAQTPRTVTIRELTEETTVERTEIVKEQPSKLSMMPEGLLQALPETQVRDLIAYLMAPAQVALPAEAGTPAR
jgi:putative membrane-bound dehydrogenase-like protein